MKITGRQKKILISIGVAACALPLVILALLPMVLSSYFSSKDTTERIESIITHKMGVICDIDTLDVNVGYLTTTVKAHNIQLQLKKNTALISNVSTTINHTELMRGGLSLDNILLTASNITYLDPYAKKYISLRNVELRSNLTSTNWLKEPLFIRGTSSASLGIADTARGAATHNIGVFKVDFSLKVDPQKDAISLNKTRIASPYGTLVLSAQYHARLGTGSIEYDLTVPSTTKITRDFPKLIPAGYSLVKVATKGTGQISTGRFPQNIQLTGEATIAEIQHPLAAITKARINYETSKKYIHLNLVHAEIFKGTIQGNLTGKLHRNSVNWSATGRADDIDIAEALSKVAPDIMGPAAKHLTGKLSLDIQKLRSSGWLYNPILKNLSFIIRPTIRQGVLNKKWFDLIKSGISGFASNYVASKRDREILMLLDVAPSPHHFNMKSGTITYKRNSLEITRLQVNGVNSFSATIQGSLQLPARLDMTVSLGNFNLLAGVDRLEYKKYPISITGKLPLPFPNFSTFFADNYE